MKEISLGKFLIVQRDPDSEGILTIHDKKSYISMEIVIWKFFIISLMRRHGL